MSSPKTSIIVFNNLRMTIYSDNDNYLLSLSIASGFVNFEISLPLEEKDVKVLHADTERAAVLQAALHHPFQFKKTSLNRK